MNYEEFLFEDSNDPQRAAIMIAMTQNLEQEKEMIRIFRQWGVESVATMVSGHNSVVYPKIVNSVVGMCLNAGLIEKKTSHIHPVVHAIQEASIASRLQCDVSQNCRLKIAAVRYKDRFCLCYYGDVAIHELSAHKTIGTGYQILGV